MSDESFAIWMIFYCKVARRCKCSGCLAEGMCDRHDKMLKRQWRDILRRIYNERD